MNGTMSKSEFAMHVGVSKSRITAMIASGMLSGAAIVGDGRHARIHVETAMAQIAARRHPGQALGNGLNTRLTAAGSAAPAPALSSLLQTEPDTASLIQLERLEFERRRNRQATLAEAQAAGRLVPIEDHQRECAQIARRVLDLFAGLPVALANELAPHSTLPARDLQHLTTGLINKIRGEAAERLRIEATALPQEKEVTLT